MINSPSQLANETPKTPLFTLGLLAMTPGVLAAFAETEANPETYLERHLCGDWGVVDEDDRLANDLSLIYGERLLSAYHLPNGIKFWVITEADRSVTTFLLPEEY